MRQLIPLKYCCVADSIYRVCFVSLCFSPSPNFHCSPLFPPFFLLLATKYRVRVCSRHGFHFWVVFNRRRTSIFDPQARSMLSYTVKEEVKDEKLPGANNFADVGGSLEDEEPMTLYTCANCTRVVALCPSSQLMCTHCVHRTGSSTVFYKVRQQPTTYDTI
ncbi:hypothetical protein, conserved [Trypanosoma brucei brucei TREU927]|uniref:Uncharacterized protein n=3 Tax=Trypanozoon TaxID=39700 RepID=Q4GZA1_TRYB2|nr:hypothetical protein, conserved [Trypanosoma brucei brucei TREU927]CAJ16061.1 hypothetical protein, conserved [Trypanosoma brucei brucei TREU927]